MIKSKLSIAGLIVVLIIAMMETACSDSDDENENTGITQSQSRNIAEEFVKESPTFTFDAIPETLSLTETLSLRCPSCWQFIFEFDSRQAGYGDRTGQMLAQVITPHTATITVDQGTVASANLDGKWDMIEQEMLAPANISVDASDSGKTIEAQVGSIITINLASNPTTGFEWAIISISNENVIKKDSHFFEAPQATNPPTVGDGGIETWMFEVISEGTSTISMGYARPWESTPPVETFELTVQIGAQTPAAKPD